ncbi:beta-ketoacyl synthase N-terminal-like domain-containing protein [Methylobrevis pamukkalensis]|uniref:Phthiocerol synthesis polyketide synthase type I PpsE n=1 Tax=Methylobrevis pamukkalensis TaxID=1439726 RepID=A0A1E3H9K6_9HYPH|nr:beta-ketoacyl synthase N-terminal-like domain-containing protein [Methylobrevis pamukkalensis]ODN72171.1 Phthiocerol synthesis polyketide synthase type I PpsE [Methylobrevis pamukkalensis]
MSQTHLSAPAARSGLEIAVIGMAGRFPGAQDVAAFWRNLVAGRETIGRWTREEALAAGMDPAEVEAEDFVPAGGRLDGADLFDAGFFGLSPGEAEILDPQQRVFLECAWTALETAATPGPAAPARSASTPPPASTPICSIFSATPASAAR